MHSMKKIKLHLKPWENLPKSLTKLETKLKARTQNALVYFLILTGKHSLECVTLLHDLWHFSSLLPRLQNRWRLSRHKDTYAKLRMPPIPYAFKTFGLHRIVVNYIPENMHTHTQNEKLLKSLGFEKERLAKDCLFINGKITFLRLWFN